MKTLLLALLLVACTASPRDLPAHSPDGPCRVADSTAEVLEHSEGYDDTAALCLHTGNGPRLLVALWYGSGPGPGSLRLLAPSGRLLDSTSIGSHVTLEVVPVTGEAVPEVVLREQTGAGTGAGELGLTVYQVRTDRLQPIFSLDNGSWFTPSTSGGGGLDSSEVSFPSPGEVWQDGVRQPLRFDSTGAERPDGPGCEYHDRYRWDAKSRSFQLQGGYSLPAHTRCGAT